MKVTTMHMAAMGNQLEAPGTLFEKTNEEWPTLEAATEYVNQTVEKYKNGYIKYIAVITGVEDDTKEQFLGEAKRACAAFGNAIHNLSANNPNYRHVNGIRHYTDRYNNGNITAELTVTEHYGSTYK